MIGQKVTQLYRIIDFPPDIPLRERRRWWGVYTGEKRPPKKGEYYISGAIPEVYRAPNDLSTNMSFHIAKLVKIREDVEYRVVDIYKPKGEK